jgi:hypothetical protein
LSQEHLLKIKGSYDKKQQADENKRNSSCQSLVNLLLWLVIETDLLREAVLILYFVLYIFNHGVFLVKF